MKLFKVTRVSFASTLSIVLCAAVISSCGSSKDSKKTSDHPTIGSMTANPTTNPDGVSTTGSANGTKEIPNTIPGTPPPPILNNGEQAAPIGKVPVNPQTGPGSGSVPNENKPSTPDFKDTNAIITGGKLGDLNYTSASDDGLMNAFRANSATVGAEQQKLKKNIAQAITGARLLKSGSDMNLDLVLTEGPASKIVRLKATTEGNRMKLALLSTTADSEFQGGFLKCLEASCDDAYAKIKIEGGYARIIFRNTSMNNSFGIQEKITDADFTKWTSYIYNTIQGVNSTATIASARASSYEVLNGKASMGIQLLTNDKEAFSVGTPLLAPDAGTVLAAEATKYKDPSANYNLPGTAGKSFVLSQLVKSASLVNNNGKGQLRLKLSIGTGAIWMTLSRVPKTTMSATEVKAFEGTFAQAW
ncbi:MAG: hypothetical protein H7235_06575 [Bdellovibrionaceae bacterium]|nr:hypothetical protein [Pseudobdellovibrionaceae bacterium]